MKLKIDLKKEEVKLKDASEKTEAFLKDLEIENKKADIKSKEVAAVTDACMEQKANILVERAAAEKDLAVALPYLKKAEGAVQSIKSGDITELKGTRNATDTTRLIFDTVNILFQEPLIPVGTKLYKMIKQETLFVEDSYDQWTQKQLLGNLLEKLL